ncbi:MAG TPA: Crp/Fnr family transcriptional regulator [Puia sp.]|nr:Crp/Fnr family transcriptional regulator [Puia sp.]
MKEILHYLNTTYWKLTDDAMGYILQHCDEQTFKAGAVLQHSGKVCEYVWFVKMGLLRAYQDHYDKDRGTMKTYNNWFMKENDIATSVVSFFRMVPSEETIEAVEDAVVYRMSRSDLFTGAARFHTMALLTLMIVIKYYCETRIVETFLRMKDAEQMHQYLLSECDDLMGRLEERHKYSFLGISDTKYRGVKSGKSKEKDDVSKKNKKKKAG